ncbi:acyl-ACP thioesterase domain-containing protein [uncultured Pseudodesulfovibrio sp.]|uniref:acyl-[acyl-carrier-protein] thioesterase n=1 Tax=uncultured Pseudodesulfovibrio sp. TaxID=2035858 RepID=UPI0029C7ADF5|nr:acyl-ACP thioesterase domain-containing protein [uncultured Pseudodesulfovibrio sp.]
MKIDTQLTLTHTYDIRSYEPRPDGEISITAICDHLQDIASRHADVMGFGLRDLEKSGHLWLLARLHLMLDRLPTFGEAARVTTWPSGNERLVANRDFLIEDAKGVIGRATTAWVTMNRETQRPDKPEQVLHNRYIPDMDRALLFPTRAITRLKTGDHTAPITARRSDIDINGHVNNVCYTKFCLESVPQEWEDTHRCMGLDIQFRSESFAGDAYASFCVESEESEAHKTLLHGLTRSEDNKEIVRMRTWWKKKTSDGSKA